MNSDTFIEAIRKRQQGQTISDALDELDAMISLSALRGQKPNVVIAALHAAAVTLPYRPDELEPGEAILTRLDRLTACAQTISKNLKDDIAAMPIAKSDATGYASSSDTVGKLATLLRLARWRVGAIGWPRNLGKAFKPELDPFKATSDILRLGTPGLSFGMPGLSSFALLATWRSQTSSVTETNAQTDIIAGRLAHSDPELSAQWAERLNAEYPLNMAMPGQLRSARVGTTALEMLNPSLAGAYRSGALNPGHDLTPDLEAQLRALLGDIKTDFKTSVCTSMLAVQIASGNAPLTIPHALADQAPFYEWLSARAALGPAETLSTMLRLVKVPADISPQALVNWACLSAAKLRGQPHLSAQLTPVERRLSPLTLRRTIKRTQPEQLAFHAEVLRLALDRVISGELAVDDRVEATDTNSVYHLSRTLAPEQHLVLAEVIVRRNELWAYQHASRQGKSVMDSEYHLPWIRLSEPQVHERAAHYAALTREDHAQHEQALAASWSRLGKTK